MGKQHTWYHFILRINLPPLSQLACTQFVQPPSSNQGAAAGASSAAADDFLEHVMGEDEGAATVCFYRSLSPSQLPACAHALRHVPYAVVVRMVGMIVSCDCCRYGGVVALLSLPPGWWCDGLLSLPPGWWCDGPPFIAARMVV